MIVMLVLMHSAASKIRFAPMHGRVCWWPVDYFQALALQLISLSDPRPSRRWVGQETSPGVAVSWS